MPLIHRAKDLCFRLLAALVIFMLAWGLSLAGGTMGQDARSGIDYVLHANYNVRNLSLAPVIDQVDAVLGIRGGLDVSVGTPLLQGSAISIQPGLPVSGKLVRGFGWQKDSSGWPYFSDGVELQVQTGAPVQAVLSGKVSRVFKDTNLGTVVVVDHNGQLSTLYGRLGAVQVQSGQQVNEGQVLGAVDGSFLHFEMRDGDQLIDPVQGLQQQT
jgi:murein DD-endopeptidase MepM/ murein hydrolase activator NlpD